MKNKIKHAFKFLLIGTAVSCSLIAPGCARPSATAYSAYVMGYFTESPGGIADNYALHLATSTDGLNWTPLNQNAPVLTPTLGTKGLRDPFILRKQDGTFEILATDMTGTDMSNVSEYIHCWDSKDLCTFTNERLLHVNTLGMHSWAPESFWDPSKKMYAIIWAGNAGDRNRTYVNYTADFKTITPSALYFDAGTDGYDADVTSFNGTHYLYWANGKIQGTKSTSLAAESFSSENYVSGIYSGNTSEAPIVFKENGANVWYLYGDSYSPVNGQFYCWKSTDIASNSWKLLSKSAYNPPLNCKHGTVTPITSAELSKLKSKWGNPVWNRIKSYSYPDHYVRNSDFIGKIDAYPFDPYTDQMWKIVPGLADSKGISFQSMDYPSYYLRQYSYNLVLNKYDNTKAFKKDATFYKTKGFADSSWTSFKSCAFPNMYIRQSEFFLKLSAITSKSSFNDKGDATFKICY